jgi:hypothetical protein
LTNTERRQEWDGHRERDDADPGGRVKRRGVEEWLHHDHRNPDQRAVDHPELPEPFLLHLARERLRRDPLGFGPRPLLRLPSRASRLVGNASVFLLGFVTHEPLLSPGVLRDRKVVHGHRETAAFVSGW